MIRTLTTLALVVLSVLASGCGIYHDGSRVNGVFGASGTVANTYAGSYANAVTAGISRCNDLLAKYQPGDSVQCLDAAGAVYIGPLNRFPGYGVSNYYGGGVVVGQYTTDFQQAASASAYIQGMNERAVAAEERAKAEKARADAAEADAINILEQVQAAP